MSKVCGFEGCGRKHYAKEYCSAHYAQLRDGRALTKVRPMKGGPKVPSVYRNNDGMKRCSGCRDWLPESHFGANAAMPDGLSTQCGKCQWRTSLWSRYHITIERYDEILAAQGGACAICREVASDRRLAVDHDHSCCPGGKSCGKCVRGLLCVGCNTGIGALRDSVDLLLEGVNYLRRYGD